VEQLRPSILIGVSTVANAFTQEVVEAMADINTRPLIFPLSNPTSLAECSFEQAVRVFVCGGLQHCLRQQRSCTLDPHACASVCCVNRVHCSNLL
jgi:hypothetical protein